LPSTIGDFQREAEKAARELRERFPDSLGAQCVTALLENNLGRTAEATQIWTECLQRDSEFIEALYGMAIVANQKGEYDRAEQLLRRLIARDRNDRKVPALLADVLMNLGRVQEAAALLEESVRAGYRPMPVLSTLGQAYLQLEEYEKAKTALESVAAMAPQEKSAHYGLARAYQGLGDKAKAKEHLEAFRRLSAEDLRVSADRIKSQDEMAAIRRLAVLIHVEAGKIYLKQGEAGKAESEWRRAAALDPRDTEGRMALASLYERSNRLEKALETCEQIRDIEPEKAASWFYVGMLNARLNRRGPARDAVAKAVALDPENAMYRQTQAAMRGE
jgi:tetratricopeptide (TPR) repeat protein